MSISLGNGGLRHSDLPQPLGMFQHTVATKEDTLRLLQSVNQAMGERGVSEEILKGEFELKWEELDEKLRTLPAPSETVRSTRTNEEMFGEIVEAVRAGATKDALVMEALAGLLSSVNILVPRFTSEGNNKELTRWGYAPWRTST